MRLFNRYLFFFTIIVLFTGCSDRPVRHLASDVSLIKSGVSTKEDVLTFLGDPDSQEKVSPTGERWVYTEEKTSAYQKTPYIGSYFDSDGYSRIEVTFEGDVVVDCSFSSRESDEFDWADDYSWQETGQ